MVRFQASKDIAEIGVLRNEYNKEEKRLLRAFYVIIVIVGASLILCVPITYYSTPNGLKRDYNTTIYLRTIQCIFYSSLAAACAVVTGVLFYNLKTK